MLSPTLVSEGDWFQDSQQISKSADAHFLCLLLSYFSCGQLCATPPGSAVPGILQARTWDWVAIAFSKA